MAAPPGDSWAFGNVLLALLAIALLLFAFLYVGPREHSRDIEKANAGKTWLHK